jgi:hypothetical protein
MGYEDTSGLTLIDAGGEKRHLKFREDVAPLTGGISKNVDEPAPIVDGGVVDLTKAESSPEAARTPQKLELPPEAKGAFVLFKVKGFEGFAPNELSRKLLGLKESGAVGALLIPEPETKDYANRFRMAQMNVRSGQLRPGKPAGPGTLRRSENPPILLLSNVKLAEGMVGSKATWIVNSKSKEKSAANIVGLVRGSDPKLAQEYVIHSAHYDHVGKRGENIFYGADDNASGTTAVLEIAKAYKSTAAPRRSVILLLVSGEERDLWGSDYFAKNPPVELTSIVGDLNTDMVGRSLLNGKQRPDYMLMTPSAKHPKFNSLAKRALELGSQYGMPDMPSGDMYWQRSDHYNFSKNGIPVMFLCNGEHEDYHKPTDTADKIDPDKIARSAKLAFHLGYEVAMDDKRPHDIAPEPPPESKPESREGR